MFRCNPARELFSHSGDYSSRKIFAYFNFIFVVVLLLLYYCIVCVCVGAVLKGSIVKYNGTGTELEIKLMIN